VRSSQALSFAFGAVLLLPGSAAGEFRFDEIEPRSYDFNDEYFLNVYSYRPRITHRWKFRDAAIAYHITAGSLRSDELFLDTQATIRLPFFDHASGEYRFVETEDYDTRYRRNEVEVLFRVLRPDYRLPLSDTLGRTPELDGLFFGGTGVLAAEKELADLGFAVGYRDEIAGARLDIVEVDRWFEKNKENAEYTTKPTWLDLLDEDLRIEAWFVNDLPLRLELPERNGGLVFRYRQLRAGADARWRVGEGVRADLELWLERTRKRRRAPNDPSFFNTDDVDRAALKLFGQVEMDVAPLLQSSSRAEDVFFWGFHVHLLEEKTKYPRDLLMNQTIRRGESFVEVGYVLGIPSPSPEYAFGVRVATQNGFVSMRDVRPVQSKHTVTNRFLSKLGIGLEASFRDDAAYGFFQFTFSVDKLTFGGGNAQVMMRF